MYHRSIARLTLVLVLVIFSYNVICQEMEGYIVGGDYVDIESYPHSALLLITCYRGFSSTTYRCGSSIINQHFTLTAAHCVSECSSERSHVAIAVGHEHKQRGIKSSAKSFKVHERYDPVEVTSDIAIIQLKTPLKLSSKVKRVALIKPEQTLSGDVMAYVAGWGWVDDRHQIGTDLLKHSKQPVLSRNNCIQILGRLSKGTLCAGYKQGKNYAASGDSGSALIVNNFLQIGIVSYKTPTKSISITIYTDVGVFYNWIIDHTTRMYCYDRYAETINTPRGDVIYG